jgi:hypothetical protein
MLSAKYIMAILRCTKKLLSELKLKPEDYQEPQNDLSGWHANLLGVDRRKCALFTHDKTLFSFFIPGLTKPDFQRIGDVFGQSLFKTLMREEFPQRQIELFLDDIRDIHFAKTNNRSVLGSMNDLIFQLKYMVGDYGGLANADIMKLNYDLNRIPMSAIEEIYSIYELRKLLKKYDR